MTFLCRKVDGVLIKSLRKHLAVIGADNTSIHPDPRIVLSARAAAAELPAISEILLAQSKDALASK